MVINGVVALIIAIYILLSYKLLFKSDNGVRISRKDNKYKKVHELMDQYCREIGLKSTIHLHIWPKVNDQWQAAAKKRYIIVSKALLDNYLEGHKEYQLVFRFLLLHELMHINNKDMGFDLLGLLKGADYLRALRCLKEVRADIQAASRAKFYQQEIDCIFNLIYSGLEEGNCDSYRYGYPSKDKRKEYILKYQSFTEEAAIEVWEDFQYGLALNNQKVSFQVVAERLFGTVNYKLN